MEIFRSWGLEEGIRAGGPDVEWLLWACETLAGAAAGSGHAVGYPTREQAAVLSPTGPACVPQDHLEPVLLAHLRALPSAKVVLGTEVVDVLDGTDAVRVTLRDAVTGAKRVADAAYLVAATARTVRSGAPSDSRCTARIASPPRPRPCSARRCGSCSARAGTASTASTTPRARAPSSRRN